MAVRGGEDELGGESEVLDRVDGQVEKVRDSRGRVDRGGGGDLDHDVLAEEAVRDEDEEDVVGEEAREEGGGDLERLDLTQRAKSDAQGNANGVVERPVPGEQPEPDDEGGDGDDREHLDGALRAGNEAQRAQAARERLTQRPHGEGDGEEAGDTRERGEDGADGVEEEEEKDDGACGDDGQREGHGSAKDARVLVDELFGEGGLFPVGRGVSRLEELRVGAVGGVGGSADGRKECGVRGQVGQEDVQGCPDGDAGGLAHGGFQEGRERGRGAGRHGGAGRGRGGSGDEMDGDKGEGCSRRGRCARASVGRRGFQLNHWWVMIGRHQVIGVQSVTGYTSQCITPAQRLSRCNASRFCPKSQSRRPARLRFFLVIIPRCSLSVSSLSKHTETIATLRRCFFANTILHDGSHAQQGVSCPIFQPSRRLTSANETKPALRWMPAATRQASVPGRHLHDCCSTD